MANDQRLHINRMKERLRFAVHRTAREFGTANIPDFFSANLELSVEMVQALLGTEGTLMLLSDITDRLRAE